MKTLSTTSESERRKRVQDVVWLLEIDWPDQTRRYATRPVALGAHSYEGTILDAGELTLAAASGDLTADSAPTDHARLTLSNGGSEGERFESLCLRHDPEGLTCRVGMVFLPATGDAPVSGDIILLQRFEIERVRFDDRIAELWLRSALLTDGARRATRVIEHSSVQGTAPELSEEALGRALPLCFGEIERSPLVPLRLGARTALSQSLAPDDAVARVSSVEGFPASGWIQIGGELARYAALDATARTLGTEMSPLIRSTPAFHSTGATVAAVPEDGFQYAIADHPCLSVGPVCAGDGEVSPLTYETIQTPIGGREVTAVAFARLPVETDASAKSSFLAVDGVAFPNDWFAGESNNALAPLSAADTSDDSTFATVAGPAGALSLEFRRDLSDGAARYGRLKAARLKARVSASRRWDSSTQVALSLKRGPAAIETRLTRPSARTTQTPLSSHTHGDTIRDAVADSRSLFTGGEVTQAVAFDRVEGEQDLGGGKWVWPEARLACDGLVDTTTRNFLGTGLSNTSPLVFRRTRAFASAAAVLTDVKFFARTRANDGAGHTVLLEAFLNDALAASKVVTVTSTAGTAGLAVGAGGLTVDDLIAPSATFRVSMQDGSLLYVHEAWLQVTLRHDLTGRSDPLRQTRTGEVLPSQPAAISLPAPAATRLWDVTAFVQSLGGWRFFSQNGGAWPALGVSTASEADTTELYVSQLWLEVEYETQVERIVDEDLSARVRGWAPDGRLLENPAELIASLLCDGRFGGLPPERIDAASFAAASSRLAAAGYRFARRVAGAETLNDLVFSAVREARCRLFEEGGVVKIGALAPDFVGAPADFTFDGGVILNTGLSREGARTNEITNSLTMLFCEDYAAKESRTEGSFRNALTAEEPASQRMAWGRRARQWELRWHQHGITPGLMELADFTLARLAYKRTVARVVAPLATVHLERGDVARIDLGETAEGEMVGEVAEIRSGAMNRLEFAVSTTPSLCDLWREDDRTRLVLRAGMSHIYFFVEGARVASLDRAGLWRLRGELVERSLAATAMSAPIEYDAGAARLVFGCGSEGAWQSAFALDASGDLFVRGEMVERADLSAERVEDGRHYEASATGFAFSVDGVRAAALYDAASQTLRVEGEAIERAARI